MVRSLSGLVLLAVTAAPAGAQVSGTPVAPSPKELYIRALARLETLPRSPYLEYEMHQSASNARPAQPVANGSSPASFDGGSNGEGTLDEVVFERRTDRASWNLTTGGNMIVENSVLIGRHYLIPDMFLPSAAPVPAEAVGSLPQLDTLDESNLKVIATVRALPAPNYDVTLMDNERLAGCGDVEHVALHPLRDPTRYNVRELWIRSSDDVICQATYNSHLFEVRNLQAANVGTVVAKLNDDGMVTSWTDTFTVYLPEPGITFDGGGSFANFKWRDSEPDYLFDEKLWDAHARAMTTPHP